MKETKANYDTYMAGSDNKALGFVVTMERGNGNGDGGTVVQHFVVDNNDPITEIGRVTGYAIGLLAASQMITPEQANEFRLKWRKIIKD